ncbi:hypothetical protein ACHAWU_005707 [Discostella pseudostelligera]|uniref:VOC domain-containing protein n=1 Tax=Discostella pseudostelligera TaxID=259834 RepID=A0ABD3MQP2_9STRA
MAKNHSVSMMPASLTKCTTHLILLYSSVVTLLGFRHTRLSLLVEAFSPSATLTISPSHSRHDVRSSGEHRLNIGRRRCTAISSSSSSSDSNESTSNSKSSLLSSTSTISQQFTTAHILHHHAAIKTRNITNAIDFYSLLGFQVESKFVSGPARVAWLIHDSSGINSNNEQSSQYNSNFAQCRIELIEVPSYMLNEPEGMQKRAINLVERPELLGLNHVALDVTGCIASRSNDNVDDDDDANTSTDPRTSCALYQLQEWIDDLNTLSIQKFGKSLRVAVSPTKRIIGREVYEMAFLFDADGSLVELLNHSGTLEQEMDDGWIPWDGRGFVQ